MNADNRLPSETLLSLKNRLEAAEARNTSLDAENTLLRQLYERAPLSYQSLDANGNFLSVNQTWLDTLGYEREEVLGRNFGDFLHPDWRVHFQDNFPKLKAVGEILGVEFEMVKKDGSIIHVSLHGKIGKNQLGDFQQTHCIFQDITERKRNEKEKEKLQAQLIQAQKMESVGRLAGGVAHDFNNMLGVILGHTELALHQLDSTHPLFSALISISKAAERSADLTRQLLAFARKQTVAPEVVKLNDSIEKMFNLLMRLIGEDIDLVWLPGRNIGLVNIDPSQIDQILVNLCVNARDAMRGTTGKITIETGATVLDEAYCAQHAGLVPGEYILLAVSDNGCGMDPGTLAHVFEPFFTTKEVGKGTGLGLSTIYGIVKQNNGLVTCASELGQGTIFKMYLPRYTVKGQRVTKTDAAERAVRGHETILLVEDEPMILDLTTAMLETLGYNVLPASIPSEAINLARQHSGKIHMLMTDVVMPEMNGRDLAKKLLLIYPDLNRLFMSGYTADVIAHHGVLDVGIHFIQKPFSVKELAAAVREVLAQGTG